MSSILDLLQVVVIEAPYDTLGAQDTQHFFLRALTLKLKSYQNVYEDGVLPVDTYDFVSTHFLIGIPEPGSRFRPLLVFRLTGLDRCRRHRLAFPGIAALRASGAETHAKVLEKLIEEWSSRGESVSFGSAWAISKELQGAREIRDALKELMTAVLVQHELEAGTRHMVCLGVPLVHTDRHFQALGYERVESEGSVLPPFSLASLVGAEVVLLHATEFTPAALDLAERYRPYWERRWKIPDRVADVVPLRRKKAA